MSRVESAHAIIQDKTGVEGGYVDHPSDLGKGTKHGITFVTSREPEYAHLWQKYNWDGDMKTLPLEMAYEIYKLGWWDKLWLDKIHAIDPYLASQLFDFGINAGRFNCVSSLQLILNTHNQQQRLWPDLKEDGGMGKNTYDTLVLFLKSDKTGFAREKLVMLMFSCQNYHYLRISKEREKNEDFTNGWTSRTMRDMFYWAGSLAKYFTK